MTTQKKLVFGCNNLGINKFAYFTIPLIGIIFVIFFLAQFASAQDDTNTPNTQEQKQIQVDTTTSMEAAQDSRVTANDLGVKKNNMLI